LKNFSMEDFRDFINEQQVLALNIVIALATIIVALVIINIRLGEFSDLKRQTNDLAVKEEPARKYEKVLKQNRTFSKTVPMALMEEEMIPYLANIADRHHVIIHEFQPPFTMSQGFYREIKLSFSCVVESFHDALKFLNDIENSKYLLKVNVWALNLDKKEQDLSDPDSKTKLSMSIEVSSMQLIENDDKNDKKQ